VACLFQYTVIPSEKEFLKMVLVVYLTRTSPGTD